MTEDLPDEDKKILEKICKRRLDGYEQQSYDDDFINCVYLKGEFAGLIRADYDCWSETPKTSRLAPVQIAKLGWAIKSRVNKFFDDKMSEENIKRQSEWKERQKDPKF